MQTSPTWKNAPLPEPGRPLDVRVDGHFGPQNRRITARTVQLVGTALRLVPYAALGVSDTEAHIVLDARSPIDRWSYVPMPTTTTVRFATLDEATTTWTPDTVQDMIDAGRVAANLPVPIPMPSEPTVDQLAEQDHGLEDGETVAEVEAPADTSMIDHNLLRQLDKLKQRKRSATAEAEDAAGEIRRIEALVIEQMAMSGQVNGYPFDDRKATIRTDTWGKRNPDVTDAEYYQAFRDAGDEWSDLVQPRVNAQALKARMAEWEEKHGELPDSLPESLRAVMATSDVLSVTFSNATRTRASRRAKPALTTAS